MTIQQMKDAIVAVYETRSWKKKVENMYDDQVIAIYHNFLNRGILDKTLRKERPVTVMVDREQSNEKQICQQMTMFDFIKE